MKFVCLSLLVLSTSVASDPGAGSLKEARQRWLRGNYEESLAIYERLAKDAKSKVPAVIGMSKAWQSLGEYDKALSAVTAAVAEIPSSPELFARQAELFYYRGRWNEAVQSAEKALSLRPDRLARWIRSQVFRDQGDLKRADAEFRWFVRTYSERSSKDDDIKAAEELLLVGLAGAENARWHNLSDQFKFILTDVFGDALKADKDFWPAEYEAAMLLLEKYNQKEAFDALKNVLVINPNAAEALVARGRIALQKFEAREAEDQVERALKINPRLPEARRLLADIHLLAGDLKAALAELDKAREINPRDERTLGRIAAYHVLRRDDRSFAALVSEVLKYDPKPGIFYYELAERLEERKLFDAAEKYYKKANELRPMLPGPNNSLGLLCMRLGREKEALEILTKAFQVDEFNVRVANSLKVLRHLQKYETLKTEHFEIRFDPNLDAVLAKYMAEYLETIYADLSTKFQYRPPARVLVEVFNNHTMFSGRTIALPDLHTIGASTGRIVAMVSPRGKGLSKPFNWARVLRHELVHIFNLEQTQFLCPHWLTEGLAVIQEGFPRPQQWNALLKERVPADKVMNLDNIDLGFIRPRSSEDWHMAYCQSELYVRYIQEKHGPKAIGQLLSAFAEGIDTEAVISRVCKVDKKTFEKRYRAYLQEEANKLHAGRSRETQSFAQLQKAHASEPDNPDIAARLAEQYLARRDRKEARKLADTVLAKKSNHSLASLVKARLLLDSGDDEQARTLLLAALDRTSPEPKVLEALGKMYFESNDFAKAAETYELAHQAEPYESRWLNELLKVYNKSADKSKQIEVLKKLVPTDADNLAQRKKLAKLLLEAKNAAEAETYARKALEIDVLDQEANQLLQQALIDQDKRDAAERLRQLLKK